MFNFNSPVSFYLPEIAFVALSISTLVSIRSRNKKKVRFNERENSIQYFDEPKKLYIQLKDVIIDTYSANPKKDPGNIEKMDPIGHAKRSYYKLKEYYTVLFIYENGEEVWWAREHFGNEIIPILRTYPKQDSIFISTKPETDFKTGEFIRFGNGKGWPEITEYLLKK